MRVIELAGAITEATENGGSWGKNLHPSKDVILRIGDRTEPMRHLDRDFADGICLLSFTDTPVTSIGGLRDGLASLDGDLPVNVWVGGRGSALVRVSCSVLDGSFCLILDGDTG
jgi:hypothetical protein